MQTSIFDYFEITAKRLPYKIFLVDESGSYSFAEVYHRALCIGTYIATRFGCVNRPAAVLTGRRAECICGFLGVLASGNYYVPLDEKMPEARRSKILERIDPVTIIDGKECCIAGDEELLKERRRRVLDVDPAYVFFTSGSTGEPKGIAVSHRNLMDFTEWYTEEFGSSEGDICGNQPPFYFDASGRDLFPCMKTGGTIHILPQKLFMFPMELVRYLDENRINTLNWATSAFIMLANSGALERLAPDSIRRVVLGGEALPARQLNIWKAALPEAEYINVYGPTEITVDCCFYRVDRDFADDEPIPIGKACRNMELLVIKEENGVLTEAGPGEVGELYVRGSGVSDGYIDDFEKSSKAFVQNPLNSRYFDRVYRTGDIVKLGEDGNLFFLSRSDGQIKHMGYRIELGEIETALNSMSGVDVAVCLHRAKDDRLICAYSGTADKKQMAVDIRALLPRYMHPNIYINYEALPMNANGKIDRALLKKELCDEADD